MNKIMMILAFSLMTIGSAHADYWYPNEPHNIPSAQLVDSGFIYRGYKSKAECEDHIPELANEFRWRLRNTGWKTYGENNLPSNKVLYSHGYGGMKAMFTILGCNSSNNAFYEILTYPEAY